MPLELALARSRRWMTECASLVDGVSFETTDRKRVATSLLHLSVEHQTGIHTLVDHGVIGSAFALFRPQFESFVRGTWYHRCATQDQVVSFLGGAEPPKIAVLIQDIETLQAFSGGLLEQTRKSIWRHLNDFTHGGTIQVKARNSLDEVASRWTHEHIARLLEAAAAFSKLAAVGIAAVAENEALALALEASYRSIYEAEA